MYIKQNEYSLAGTPSRKSMNGFQPALFKCRAEKYPFTKTIEWCHVEDNGFFCMCLPGSKFPHVLG